MTAIIGTQKVYYKKFKFLVEIAGVVSAAFQTAGPLEMQTEDIDHYEGGNLIPDKSPGLVTVTNCTLTRGATDDEDLYNWFKETVAADSLVEEPDFKRSIDIVQQNRVGEEVKRWTLVNAYPKRFLAGEWDNGANENVINEVELRYDYFVKGGDNGL